MKWVDHVAQMRDMRNAYKMLDGKPEGRTLGRLGVGGSILLKRILKKQGVRVRN
jgi:hypothetical protein